MNIRFTMKKNKGITFIEVIISLVILLFLFFAVFYTLGNVLSGSILAQKKVEIINELDTRVNHYDITGSFDETSSNGITFSQTSISAMVKEFVASSQAYGISVLKRSYASLGAIERELGPYMKAADAIYIAAGATVIDPPEIKDDIDAARAAYLSASTAKWSGGGTGLLLNVGNTQIVTAVPLNPPIIDRPGLYLTVAPFTNADITPEGVVWRCTPFGVWTDEEKEQLLSPWCVL
jgi:type II secretory pathway pseudopilin PulG